RIDPALEVDEFLVAALPEFAGQLVQRHAQGFGQLWQAFRRLEQLLRIAPDRLHRRRHRQRLAVAVGDHAARGRDRDLAQEARIALLAIEVVVDQLQVDGATDQGKRTQPQRAGDQRQAGAQVELGARAGTRRLGRGPAIAGPAAAGPAVARPAHGRTTTMSRVSGKAMPRRVRATWSMRLLSAQVACSSCRRPNSMLSSSRARSSLVSSVNSWRCSWRANTTATPVPTLARTSSATRMRVVMPPPAGVRPR